MPNLILPVTPCNMLLRYKKVAKEPIGKGGMGKVFKCSALEDGHICAIKKIKLDRRDAAAGPLIFTVYNT